LGGGAVISVGRGHRPAWLSRGARPRKNEAKLFAAQQRARSLKSGPLACAALCGKCQACREQSNLALHLRERQSSDPRDSHGERRGYGEKAGLSCDYALMRAALGAAVPLKIAELQRLPWSMVQAQAKRCAGPIAWQGDVLLFRGEKVGRTTELFVDLVTGIASLAFGRDGVSIFHLHFRGVHRGAAVANAP
jgi:hypothetical protein